MGRPAGSKNKPKPAATSDDRPATTRHNEAAAKADLTEDQHRALLVNAVKKYAAAIDLKDKYQAEFIKVCKVIKSDGVSIDDVKTAIKLQTPEGEAELQAKIAAQIRVAKWYNSPVGTQATFFDASNGHVDENASYRAGKTAGLEGVSAKAPAHYDTNEWLRGWQEGQLALVSNIKQQKKRDADEFDAPGATH